MNRSKIAVFGSALVDLIALLMASTFTFTGIDKVRYMAFPIGVKGNLENLFHRYGGAMMNVVTAIFHLGNAAVPYCVIGHDAPGGEIVRELQKMELDTSHVVRIKKGNDGRPVGTGESIVLTLPDGERSPLPMRGASACFSKLVKKMKFNNDIGWAYVASLGGDLKSLEKICDKAAEKSIKVFLNPGDKELKQPEKLKSILSKITVLALNKEEAQELVEGSTLEDLTRNLLKYVPNVIITDGPNGLIAYYEGECIMAGLYDPDVEVVARVGAGDACLAGIILALAEGKTLREAITIGLGTATEVCKIVGSREDDYAVIYGPFSEEHLSFIKSVDLFAA